VGAADFGQGSAPVPGRVRLLRVTALVAPDGGRVAGRRTGAV
jgi:hypothetical protein